MTPLAVRILELHDAGKHPAAIADGVNASLSAVYKALRDHRPERARKPRKLTSEKREPIRALYKIGTDPARIAKLMKCSRAYVYRTIGE